MLSINLRLNLTLCWKQKVLTSNLTETKHVIIAINEISHRTDSCSLCNIKSVFKLCVCVIQSPDFPGGQDIVLNDPVALHSIQLQLLSWLIPGQPKSTFKLSPGDGILISGRSCDLLPTLNKGQILTTGSQSPSHSVLQQTVLV